MNFFNGCGHQFRLVRQGFGLSLHDTSAVADYSGASAQQLSAYERGGRLREDVLRRLEYVFESLYLIKNYFPFAVNTKDVTSLKLTLAAFERRDMRWLTEHNAKPELPPFVTY